MRAHLRVARPTDDLDTVAAMYAAGLGLEILGSFTGHEGFDGVMVGCPGQAYHLEFTAEPAGAPAGRAPSAENLLVFYLPDAAEWASRCAAMEAAGFRPVSSHNPYWDIRGRSFEDPDGYRVVIVRASWPD